MSAVHIQLISGTRLYAVKRSKSAVCWPEKSADAQRRDAGRARCQFRDGSSQKHEPCKGLACKSVSIWHHNSSGSAAKRHGSDNLFERVMPRCHLCPVC